MSLEDNVPKIQKNNERMGSVVSVATTTERS